ncbi:GNAT family N-acetyltransferase [soil metagenome]
MSTPTPAHHDPITVRPAQRADLPIVADLLIQLYAAELPGALNGPMTGQQRLMRFTLEANDMQGLHRRYVACTADGLVVATAALEVPDEAPYARAPTGTIGAARRFIGARATARLLLTVAQSLIGASFQRPVDAVFIHSVVVDARQRGQGIGRTLMQAIEQIALAQGYPAALLQVLAANQPARQLYRQCGYTDIWQSPSWASLLSWPSYIMQKKLIASPHK